MSPLTRGGAIFFDITLLVLRAGYRTPTGVARVELAYATALLKRYPDRVCFVVALQKMVQVVPNAVAERYLATLAAAWRRQASKQSVAATHRLMRFLGLQPGAFSDPAPDAGAQSRAGLLATNMLVGAALKNLLPQRLKRLSRSPEQNVYIHVSGSNLPSPWIEQWLARSPSVSSVFLMHDVIPLTHPEYVRTNVPARHARYVRRVLKAADVVVANSTFTAETLTGFAQGEALQLPNVVVAPLGVGEVFARRPAPTAKLPPYFVFVSTIEPRKNHLMLLQVWSRLHARYGEETPKLILVGRRGWENENIVDILERAHTSGHYVLECNGLSDETLASLIRNARAALMPSHVEGFGLPVAEALSLGTPVICSDLAPFREVAGDVPEYVDPLAGRGWAKLIMQYARENSAARRAQLKRIETYRAPAWADHFERVWEVVSTLCARPPSRGPAWLALPDEPQPRTHGPAAAAKAPPWRFGLDAALAGGHGEEPGDPARDAEPLHAEAG